MLHIIELYSFCFYADFIPEKPKLPEKKYYIDTNQIHLPKENMEIINPVKDGMSEYEEYSNRVLNDVIYLAELTFIKKFKKCTFKGILMHLFEPFRTEIFLVCNLIIFN